ncbi:MAG: polysaccharide biosynthesis/export family protein [Pseudomonadota bacterium]
MNIQKPQTHSLQPSAFSLQPIQGIIFLLFLILSAYSALAKDYDYRIGPRDLLAMSIYAGGEKQAEVELVVSADGEINVPFLGPLNVKNLTLSELEQRIKEPLSRDYFVDPQVHVQIKEYHSLRYYISGAVKNPGLFETASRATLMELIAQAGGVLPERGNVAYLLRGSTDKVSQGKDVAELVAQQDPISIDLAKLLDKGDMSANLALESGDVIYIPLQKTLSITESKVYVEGEVKSPGVYDYQSGLTALNACIMAGGFDKFAAPNRTRIVRKEDGKQVIIRIDLDDVKKGKSPDVELKPGDLVQVPEAWL